MLQVLLGTYGIPPTHWLRSYDAVMCRVGFEAGQSITYDRDQASAVMGAASRSVRSKRDAVLAGAPMAVANALMDFTPDERGTAAGK